MLAAQNHADGKSMLLGGNQRTTGLVHIKISVSFNTKLDLFIRAEIKYVEKTKQVSTEYLRLESVVYFR